MEPGFTAKDDENCKRFVLPAKAKVAAGWVGHAAIFALLCAQHHRHASGVQHLSVAHCALAPLQALAPAALVSSFFCVCVRWCCMFFCVAIPIALLTCGPCLGEERLHWAGGAARMAFVVYVSCCFPASAPCSGATARAARLASISVTASRLYSAITTAHWPPLSGMVPLPFQFPNLSH